MIPQKLEGQVSFTLDAEATERLRALLTSAGNAVPCGKCGRILVFGLDAGRELVDEARNLWKVKCPEETCGVETVFRIVMREKRGNPNVTNVLGETRAIKTFFPCGSFTCPFCQSAVSIDHTPEFPECGNPWCSAHPHADKAAHEKLAAQEAEREREAANRKRTNEWAMQRLEEQRAEEARQLTEVVKAGQCAFCFERRGKRIKHRGLCPRIQGR